MPPLSGVSKNAPFGSYPKTNWTEIDPIAGVSIGFAKQFKLDVTYTAFAEQILNIGTTEHLEIKFSADDTPLLGAFALHPYISFWHELKGKATTARVPFTVFGASAKSGSNPSPGESFYFDIGVAPGYTFKDSGNVKVEFPCRVQFADKRFYGEYYKSASPLALYELGIKASMPLKFMPKGYGNWSTHIGYKFINFTDDNLYNLNTFLAPGEPTRTTSQVYGGVSVFF